MCSIILNVKVYHNFDLYYIEKEKYVNRAILITPDKKNCFISLEILILS